jgi:excisionase family DNA binding protein
MDKDLTISEAAARLKVHSRTVQGWIDQGYFPNAYKMGLGLTSPWLIPESDVQEFDAERRKNNRPKAKARKQQRPILKAA